VTPAPLLPAEEKCTSPAGAARLFHLSLKMDKFKIEMMNCSVEVYLIFIIKGALGE